jgi:FkbM family methyltransferase
MGLFKGYFSWHRKRVNETFRHQLSGRGGRLVIFFNIHAYLAKNNERLGYNKSDGTYRLVGSKTRYFLSPKTAQWSYWNGSAVRGASIGNGYFLDEIQFNNGDLIVDCGAHIGDLKLYFENIGVDVEYIGFEPSLPEFLCLEKNVYPSKVYNIGLWKDKSSLKFFRSSFSADSSFIEPKSYTETSTILVDRLSNIESRHIRLLKLEAEGGEPEVLIGCIEILQNIDYISADLGFERGASEENTFPEVINFLLYNGSNVVKAIAPSGRNTILFMNSRVAG